MPDDIPFRDIGIVVSRQLLQGSFMAVMLEYDDTRIRTTRTVGLGDDYAFPTMGERIRITGIVRNGRHLTKEWRRVGEGVR